MINYLTKFKGLCVSVASYAKSFTIFSNGLREKPLVKPPKLCLVNAQNTQPSELSNAIFQRQTTSSNIPVKYALGLNFIKIYPSLLGKYQGHFRAHQIACFSTKMPGSSETMPIGDKCADRKVERLKKVPCPQMPPCLKFVFPPGQKKPISSDKISCGRICMPCCPPARYPPVCYFPSNKVKCCKIPNPRPAYSECDKECYDKRNKICDCCNIKPPPCRLLPEIDDKC